MKLALVLVAAAALTVQDVPRFSSDVPLVMVDVQVLRRDTGRILEFLGPKDFELYDNGSRREISIFDFEAIPLDIVFLIYGRDGWGLIKDVRNFHEGLHLAVETLSPADRAAVLRTDSESKIAVPLCFDRRKIRRALDYEEPYPTGYGHLYQAISVATTLFSKLREPARRRVIVAITDDIEHGSRITIDRLITDLLESNITLNAVIVVLAKRRMESPMGDSLRLAVEATGGESIPGDLFRERFQELTRRIRMRYLLGFYASSSINREYRTLEVRLSDEAKNRYPNAVIRARRGYYAQPVEK